MLSTETPNLPATAKYHLPPMHPEGRKFVGAAAVATLVVGFALHWTTVGWLLAALTVWIALFFRDPARTTPAGEGLLVSPADGMVSMVATVPVPRQLAGDGGIGELVATRVSVFMNVFDVHVNRSPLAGTVSRIAYVPGKFLNADLDKASDDNERQYFIVEGSDGTRVGFTQIAGLVARRIVRFVDPGERVVAGQRVGLIRFGSRVDVYLPAGYGVEVLPGQRCVAGETILARRGSSGITAGVTQ
jgi:phosphatidylserine decarboxylase